MQEKQKTTIRDFLLVPWGNTRHALDSKFLVPGYQERITKQFSNVYGLQKSKAWWVFGRKSGGFYKRAGEDLRFQYIDPQAEKGKWGEGMKRKGGL